MFRPKKIPYSSLQKIGEGMEKKQALVDEVPTEFHLKNAVQLQTKPPDHI